MKQSNFLKTLSLFFVVIVTMFTLASCSSDKDEPENPDNSGSGFGTEAMIPYSSLPGTWIIESIKDSETGKVISINQTIKINNFEPKQEPSNVVTNQGYQVWAETYFDVLSYQNLEKEENSYIIIGFSKYENKVLQSSLVYSVTFPVTIKNDDSNIIKSFSLADLHLSGKQLVAKESAYGMMEGTNAIHVSGSVTMKKL
ncbi:MAG: hypothetical protein K2N34_04980 [Lachnospiraceae bacterium]|nr:hypothetical protein [Lachnospiraceae bacterium]